MQWYLLLWPFWYLSSLIHLLPIRRKGRLSAYDGPSIHFGKGIKGQRKANASVTYPVSSMEGSASSGICTVNAKGVGYNE
jgi:hypothetical protein